MTILKEVSGQQPVIVGVGQLTRRLSSVADATSPARMMADTLEAAASDSGVGRPLLEAATSVRTVELLAWKYPNPPAAVAAELGIEAAEYVNTTTGGNSPVMLLNRSCRDIQSGEHDVILMTGCEAMYSRLLARRAGGHIEWPQQPDDIADCIGIGDSTPPTNNAEMAIGLILPVQIYPMLENALRHRLGRTVKEHRAVVGDLWSRFSKVAAGNQYAWSRDARTAEEIVTPTPDNRMVAFPYTKLQTANLQVDQAAATIVCSVDAAQRLGIPEDRWVFPLAGAEGKDHNFLSERDDLSRSPCIAACGRALKELSGVAPADATHVDLYSCFPIAVEIAAAELGLPLDRQLTLTGGLTFGGGPGNAYAFHGIAEAVSACRRQPGSVALTSALGWYVTKHSLAMLSTTPNPRGFRWRNVKDEVDALPKRAVAEGYEGPVTVETATVAYDRDGEPEKVLAAVLTPEGARGWASSADRVLADEFVAGGVIGEPAKVSGTSLV